MAIIMAILVALVSIGLVLSPVAAAYAMAAAPAALTDDAGGATMSGSMEKCPCCDMVGKCPMAICTMSCVQLGPTSPLAFDVTLVGHAAFSEIVPLMHYGLSWRPPTPPPRV